jgi:hypothetical protein
MPGPALAARIRTEGPHRLKRPGWDHEAVAVSFGVTLNTLIAMLPDECLTDDQRRLRGKPARERVLKRKAAS